MAKKKRSDEEDEDDIDEELNELKDVDDEEDEDDEEEETPKKETRGRKKKETVDKVIVVNELPTQQVREFTDKKSGEDVKIVTIGEALTEILSSIREIKKSVA